jgi:site-specific recombinase XerD
MLTDQQLNSQLLRHGAHTSGSYDRRLERLHRFISYDRTNKTKPRDAKITAALNQRGKFNQSERSAAWALTYLRNYQHESFQTADIPTSNADYDYCVRERNGTMYYVQVKPAVQLSPGVFTSWT